MMSAPQLTLSKNATILDRSFNLDGLAFDLPAELEAHEPPEARGLARDEVRLLVSYRSTKRVVHARFHDVGSFFTAGDVVVINTSGTLPAALNAVRSDGSPIDCISRRIFPPMCGSSNCASPGRKGPCRSFGQRAARCCGCLGSDGHADRALCT